MSVWLTNIPLLTSLPFPTATWYSQPLEYRSCCFSPPKVKVPRIHRASNFCTAASGKPVIACVFVCTRKSFIFPIESYLFMLYEYFSGPNGQMGWANQWILSKVGFALWFGHMRTTCSFPIPLLPWISHGKRKPVKQCGRFCQTNVVGDHIDPWLIHVDPFWWFVGYNSNSTKQRTNIFTERNHRVGWPFCTQPGIHGQFPTGGEQESFSDITASHCLLIWRRSASKCLRVRDLWCFLSALCPTCTWAVWTWRGKSMFSFHDWLHLMVFSSRGVCLVNTTWTLESTATTTHLPAITSSTACCILGSRELDVLWGTAIQTLKYWWPTCSSLRCGLCSTQ